MKIPSLILLLAAGSLAAAFVSQATLGNGLASDARSAASIKVEPVYSVKVYDPSRDPAKDLLAAIAQARADNKKILMQVGGDWCGWCKRLQTFFHEKPELAKTLHSGFLILKVNYDPQNENEKFLSRYPEIEAFPHLFVLGSTGKLLKSQDAAIFEEKRSYNEKRLLAFLMEWSAAK